MVGMAVEVKAARLVIVDEGGAREDLEVPLPQVVDMADHPTRLF